MNVSLFSVHILVANLFVNGVSTMLWVSFSDILSCITDTHFVLLLFFTLRFSAQAVFLRDLVNPRESWIPSFECRRIHQIYFQHSLADLLSYTSYKSWKSVCQLSYITMSCRGSLDFTVCSHGGWFFSHLPRLGEHHEEALIWHQSKNNTNEAMSCTRFHEHRSSSHAGNYNTDSRNHDLGWKRL